MGGRQIVLTTRDDDNRVEVAESNARALVEQDKVFLLFGSIEGGPSSAVMKAAIDLNVPFLWPHGGRTRLAQAV